MARTTIRPLHHTSVVVFSASRFISVKLHIFLALFIYVVYIADVAPWATRREKRENRGGTQGTTGSSILLLLSYPNNNLLST